MYGQGEELRAAAEGFTRALPVTEELAVAAEAVLAAVTAELEQTQDAVERLRVLDGGHDLEMARASRQGAITALSAERARWHQMVNRLRQVPERGIGLGWAYFEGQKPDPIPGPDPGPAASEGR